MSKSKKTTDATAFDMADQQALAQAMVHVAERSQELLLAFSERQSASPDEQGTPPNEQFQVLDPADIGQPLVSYLQKYWPIHNR